MKRMQQWLVGAMSLALFGSGTAGATIIDVDVTDAQSWGDFTDPSNTIILFDVGTALGCAGCAITIDAVGWDVGITAYGTSWYSQAFFSATDTAVTDGILRNPGVADTVAGNGVERFYNSGGLTDLIGADQFVLSDGILRIRFVESFEDNEMPDAIWSGTLSFNAAVPEPGSLMLFSLGLIVCLPHAARRTTRAR